MKNEEFELLLQKASIGCCKKEELLEAKERLESHLEDVNAQCAEYEQVIQMMDLEGKNTDNPEEVRKAMESYGIENPQIAIDELKKLRESRNITAHYISAFSDALAEFRNFDKYICFNNIRTLLKVNSDVKIGMIEKEAGVRLGYMSRLEKPDNTSEPTMEFVSTAAKMLDVNIDFLVSANIDEVTPTEEYVLKFLKNISDDAKSGRLYWNRQPCQRLNIPTDLYSDFGPSMHPLQGPDDDSMDCNGNYHTASFYSRFYEEKKIDVIGNIYWANLEDAESDIYIFPCAIYSEQECLNSQACYEIYLIAPDKSVIPLCNTLRACDLIKSATKDLYMQIEVLSSHVNIDNKARSVIDAYMKKDKKNLSKIFEVPKTTKDECMIDPELPFN
jgi:hypothetical protein